MSNSKIHIEYEVFRGDNYGKIRVAIADDNKEFCQIIAQFISAQEEFQVVGVARMV